MDTRDASRARSRRRARATSRREVREASVGEANRRFEAPSREDALQTATLRYATLRYATGSSFNTPKTPSYAANVMAELGNTRTTLGAKPL